MRTVILISVLFTIGIDRYASAQDPKEILKQSYQKCQSIRNGYYEMTKEYKQMHEKNVSKLSFHCYFEKLSFDSIYSSAFHYKIFNNKKYYGEVLYSGNDFVRGFSDSSAIIMSKSMWAKEIKSYIYLYSFYSPFTTKWSYPLQHDSDFIDNKHSFKYVEVVFVNDILCNHIQVNETPINSAKQSMKVLKQEYNYWISRDDKVPVKYSISMDVLLNKDTLHQYETYTLEKYQINNLYDDSVFAMSSIPPFYRMKDFVPYKNAPPIQNKVVAQKWELNSITNEKVSLDSLKGNLVLLNFFYMSCYPCAQVFPILDSLNKKYKDSNLRVIGINTNDTMRSELSDYISSINISFPILMGGKDVAKEYHVTGYPAIYLIDKTGTIVFIQVGYGKGVDEILDKIIQKNLN